MSDNAVIFCVAVSAKDRRDWRRLYFVEYLGVRTYKRGTVNRGQLLIGQLIARTHNRADS